MVACPNCGHKEIQGALFCGECGAHLGNSPARPTQSIHSFTNGLKQQQDKQENTPNPPRGDRIALRVLETGQIITLGDKAEVTLGRAAEEMNYVPEVDLSSYNAYEKGISRMHASIVVGTDTINLIDLNSVNGTRLNGEKLEPYQARPLQHGDLLTLGKLKLQVLIQKA